MEHIIEIKDLKKIYLMGDEKITALDNINLSIGKGEMISILGTSGSGKSTLLNMMAGLEKPSRGQIKISGLNIERLSENKLTKFRQKHIGFIFQSFHLIQTLTALENVSLPLIFLGLPKRIRDKKAADMLKAVGLGDRLKHLPSRMSGGQQQRVCIARAFIGKPQIICADEPTGNLDTKTTSEVMETIISMVKENNQTLVIVSHDPDIAKITDRVISIRDGKIIKIENN